MNGSTSCVTGSVLGGSQPPSAITTGMSASLRSLPNKTNCFLIQIIIFFLKNRENKPKKGGICVANHTSPIDIVILCNDGCYAMVPTSLFASAFPHRRCDSPPFITEVICPSGGSGARGPDGSRAESHGEVLSSRLVRESGDERSPPSDQEVCLRLSHILQRVLSSMSLHVPHLYFLSVATLALGEFGIFQAVKPSRVSVSPLIQTRTDLFLESCY